MYCDVQEPNDLCKYLLDLSVMSLLYRVNDVRSLSSDQEAFS